MGALSLDTLQSQVRAPLVTPSHPAYDDVRRVWNGMIDRRPLLIVHPEYASEVAAAIAFAREHDLELSVKGGGHGVAGRAVCDDGLVIDLSRMRAVSVDPAHAPQPSRVARRFAISMPRLSPTASPPRRASTVTPASPAWRSAAASAC